MTRASLSVLLGAAITLGPALIADQTGTTSVQYTSPAGVEYRSLPDTEAITNARAALAADPLVENDGSRSYVFNLRTWDSTRHVLTFQVR